MVQETVRWLRYDCRDQGPDYSSCLRKQQAHMYGNGNVIIYCTYPYAVHGSLQFFLVGWNQMSPTHTPAHDCERDTGSDNNPENYVPYCLRKACPSGFVDLLHPLYHANGWKFFDLLPQPFQQKQLKCVNYRIIVFWIWRHIRPSTHAPLNSVANQSSGTLTYFDGA